MKHFFKNIRHIFEYLFVLFFYMILRILPRAGVGGAARLCGWAMRLIPGALRICEANIRIAFPDWTPAQARTAARKSLYHVTLNFLEFAWMSGNRRRIERICAPDPAIVAHLREYAARGVRIIFVTPHLGSWEASGMMVPYYTDIPMVAIAKPVKNPYLNRLLNSHGREKAQGLKIIFARGAMRAAVRALRDGVSLGTLIDQNTRVRDGGEFVDFFGLPAPSSMAPAVLMRHCRANGIPAVLIYGASVRENGRIIPYIEELPKPFEEYGSDREVIGEVMRMTEKFIRRFPDQYVWYYKRFNYIPREADDALRKRYPWYSIPAAPTFYRKVRTRR